MAQAYLSGRSYSGREFRKRSGDAANLLALIEEYGRINPDCDTITIVLTGLKKEPQETKD